jgi:hypothetical protein
MPNHWQWGGQCSDLAELAQLLGQLPPLNGAAVEPVGYQNNLDLVSPTFTRPVDHPKCLRCRLEVRAERSMEPGRGASGRCSHFARIGRNICEHEAGRESCVPPGPYGHRDLTRSHFMDGEFQIAIVVFSTPPFRWVAVIVLRIDLESSCECCANKYSHCQMSSLPNWSSQLAFSLCPGLSPPVVVYACLVREFRMERTLDSIEAPEK